MEIQTLVRKLRAINVTFHADRGRLRIKAPPGILTYELKTLITQNKSAIISYLERESARPKHGKMKKERLRAARDVL